MNEINGAARLRIEPSGLRGQPVRLRNRSLEWKGPTGGHLRAFVELYYAVEGLRTSQDAFVVQFLEADAGADGGSMAMGYASVAAASRREPVLLIEGASAELDPGLLAAPALLECLHEGRPLSAGFVQWPDQPQLWRARLTASPAMVLDVDTDGIHPFLQDLGHSHPIVVLNSPSLDLLPAGAGLSRFCDGTVLVVAAGKTRSASVAAARLEIERAGGQVIGAAMHGGQSGLPNWLRRWF